MLETIDLTGCKVHAFLINFRFIFQNRYFHIFYKLFYDNTLQKISNLALISLGISNRGLETIIINECDHVSDNGVVALTKGCSGILALGLSRLKITDIAISAVTNSCKRLRFLNLGRCRNISDSSIKNVAIGLPQLQVLRLERCISLTADAMSAIAKV